MTLKYAGAHYPRVQMWRQKFPSFMLMKLYKKVNVRMSFKCLYFRPQSLTLYSDIMPVVFKVSNMITLAVHHVFIINWHKCLLASTYFIDQTWTIDELMPFCSSKLFTTHWYSPDGATVKSWDKVLRAIWLAVVLHCVANDDLDNFWQQINMENLEWEIPVLNLTGKK